MRRFLPIMLCFSLTGCFSMPHPFSDPGQQARQLATANLPPPRLAIPTPKDVSLPPNAAQAWASSLAQAMVAQAVPAVAQPQQPGDWWVKMSTKTQNGAIVPHYVIIMPTGKERAENDGPPVDLAGWNSGDLLALKGAAVQEAPVLANMLTGIQAAMMQQDPHSLMNRPAHIYFKGVKGAPGDGNQSLARAFFTALPDHFNSIQTTPKGADFTVIGIVKISKAPKYDRHAMQHIEISWRVLSADGKEAGAATQLHDIVAHSLDKAWGDTAMAAGEEAAGGVRTIITNYSGREHKPLPPTNDDKKHK
ncbi:hypothetical protein [Swingsia samuiensis]|uniref:Uncharacterized protein n=1 Tax=Swingsia samuiensis TaxID=1293412 RepID=A0A4Y6UKD3_9PROT|nr:hypothetical protein [Swingsia samuiensis]QDH16851.1 hypothetical protein E3D00_04165 [Swingsia samuiensis]